MARPFGMQVSDQAGSTRTAGGANIKGATVFVGATFTLLLAGCATGNDPAVSSRRHAPAMSEQVTPEQTDVSSYVATISEQPERFKLRHRCGYENSWNRDRGLGPTNEDW